MNNVVDELVAKLKEIYDNRDFVNGIMSKITSLEHRNRMLEFIKEADRRELTITASVAQMAAYLIEKGRISELENFLKPGV